ncbi:MAG: hypothetical protein ACKOAY_11160 [Haliscomenobacter sp.]
MKDLKFAHPGNRIITHPAIIHPNKHPTINAEKTPRTLKII